MKRVIAIPLILMALLIVCFLCKQGLDDVEGQRRQRALMSFSAETSGEVTGEACLPAPDVEAASFAICPADHHFPGHAFVAVIEQYIVLQMHR